MMLVYAAQLAAGCRDADVEPAPALGGGANGDAAVADAMGAVSLDAKIAHHAMVRCAYGPTPFEGRARVEFIGGASTDRPEFTLGHSTGREVMFPAPPMAGQAWILYDVDRVAWASWPAAEVGTWVTCDRFEDATLHVRGRVLNLLGHPLVGGNPRGPSVRGCGTWVDIAADGTFEFDVAPVPCEVWVKGEGFTGDAVPIVGSRGGTVEVTLIAPTLH